MTDTDHDAVVVGGGPVGCAAALALAAADVDTCVLEAHEPEERAPDSRTLALSWNSRLILERLNSWTEDLRATAINTVHVSDRGRFGRATLEAVDLDLPALGYVLRYSRLFDSLSQQVQAGGIRYRTGFRVDDIRPGSPTCEVTGSTSEGSVKLRARLVIIADGGMALTRLATKHVREHDYCQRAVVGLTRTDRAHGNRAYERFTRSGPIALLPCEEEFAFVWTCTPDHAQALASLDDDAFLSSLQEAFGDRAGRFVSVRQRSAFPLALRMADRPVGEGIVLVGNASQTLHPIAGQGFNLGLRDAWDLGDLTRSVPREAIGSASVTSSFHGRRRADRAGSIIATHGLEKVFSSDFLPLVAGRGFGLSVLTAFPPLRRTLMRQMIFGAGS